MMSVRRSGQIPLVANPLSYSEIFKADSSLFRETGGVKTSLRVVKGDEGQTHINPLLPMTPMCAVDPIRQVKTRIQKAEECWKDYCTMPGSIIPGIL